MCREETVRRLGEAPSAAEVFAMCPEPDYAELERVLLEWEEGRRATVSQEPLGAFDEPWFDVAPRLALLPTDKPWATPAYTHFWGGGSADNEALVRTLQVWFRRHGAVPWGGTSVTIYLHVQRPLASVSDALRVAVEQLPFCKMDESLRQRARRLLNSRAWELYDRP